MREKEKKKIELIQSNQSIYDSGRFIVTIMMVIIYKIKQNRNHISRDHARFIYV